VTPKLPWIIAGVAGAAAAGVLVTTRAGGRVVHPEPRPGVTAERVLPASTVLNTPGAAEAYAAARQAPQMAVLAARLASQGGSLDEVRRAIDQRFGS